MVTDESCVLLDPRVRRVIRARTGIEEVLCSADGAAAKAALRRGQICHAG